MQAMIRFFRANPQAFILLLICLVLGIGTFLVVVVALPSSSHGQISGEPSGVLRLTPPSI